MPLDITPEEKRRFILEEGLNPDEWDIGPEGDFLRKSKAQPVVNPTPTPTAPKPGRLQTFFGEAKRNIGGAVGGLGGLAAGAALAPPTGGLSLALPIAGSIAGALAGSYGQSKVEEQIFSPEELLTRAQEAEAQREAYPITAFAGGLAPQALAFGTPAGTGKVLSKFFMPSGAALTPAEKAIGINLLAGGGLGGATEAGSEYFRGEEINPLKIGLATGVGTFLSNPRALTTKFTGIPRLPDLAEVRASEAAAQPVATPEGPTPEELALARQAIEKQRLAKTKADIEAKLVPPDVVPKKRKVGEFVKESATGEKYSPTYPAKESAEAILGTRPVAEEKPFEFISDEARIANQQKILDARIENEKLRLAKQEQEAATLEAENAKLRAELEPKPIEEVTPAIEKKLARVGEKTLTGKEQIPIKEETLPDYTVRAKKTEAELAAPETEAERIQREYDEGIRLKQEGEATTPYAGEELSQIERATLTRRGVQGTELDPNLPHKGEIDLRTRKVKINPLTRDETTAFHEAGHAHFRNLLEQGSAKDKSLAQRAMKLAETGFPTSKQGPEEALNLQVGKRASELAGQRSLGTRAKDWFNDFISGIRAKGDKATADDLKNVLSRRLIEDPAYFDSGIVLKDIQDIIAPKFTGAKTKGGESIAKEEKAEEGKILKQEETEQTPSLKMAGKESTKAPIPNLAEAKKMVGSEELKRRARLLVKHGWIGDVPEDHGKDSVALVYASQLTKENKWTSEFESETIKGPTLKQEEGITPTEPKRKTIFVESMVDKASKVSPTIGKAASGFYEKFRQLKGQFTNKIALGLREHISYKNPKELFTNDNQKLQRVRQYLDDISDKGKSGIILSKEEKTIEKKVRDYLQQTFKEREARPKLKHDTKPDPNYFPHVPSRRVVDTLLNKPGSSEAKKLIQDFMAYQKSLGRSQKEAEENFKIFKAGYGKANIDIAKQFGPIDKAEGVGLPQSWREKNLMDRLTRFGNRYARRLAYHDTFETDAKIAEELGKFKGNENVDLVLEDIAGIRPRPELRTEAALAIVRSAMLGPLTGAKDFTSNLVLGFQHMEPRQTVLSALDSWKNIKSNLAKSYEQGVNRANIGTIEYQDGGVNDIISTLHRARDVINIVQGRNLLETATRATAFGQGRWLALDNLSSFARGKLGSQQRRFLDEFAGEGWDKKYKGGKISEADLDTIASRYVESVQGTYDPRGLPRQAIVGQWAPFLALSRWSIEKVNNFSKHVVTPLLEGDVKPFLMSTLGMFIGGAAIEKLVEEVTGRKSRAPELKEIAESKEQIEGLAYKAATLASLSGYAGMMGDLSKTLMDLKFKNRPQPTFSNPLVDVVQETGATIVDAVRELEDGNIEIGMDLISEVLEDNIQAYRIALAQLSSEKQEDLAKSDKFRDLKMFRNLNELEVQESGSERENVFRNKKIKEFKEETDLNKAVEMREELLSEAIAKSAGSPEKLKAELLKIKLNSYQTMPNPASLPNQFVEYISYLERTQGKEAAAARLKDYLERNQINKIKSGMIP